VHLRRHPRVPQVTKTRRGLQDAYELSTDEGLARDLGEYLKVDGAEILKQLPDGIHSGLHKLDYKGVFLYYQRRHDDPAATEHFWRFYNCETGEIDDNRLALAEMIRCRPDEPRVVDPELKEKIHSIMAEAEHNIVKTTEHQAMIESAPKAVSADQNAMLVALQQVMGAPGVDRNRIVRLLGMLAQPLLSAPVKELKKALVRFQQDRDADAFVTGCEVTAAKYSQDRSQPSGETDERRCPMTRDDLRLIGFDFFS